MNSVPQYTVLVVDDVEVNLEVMKAILDKTYHVLVALNGKTALALAEQLRPDLILLDVMMPGMDGYEVCIRLKKHDVTRTIPIVFVTGLVEDTAKKRGGWNWARLRT